MKMARASQADIDAALEVTRILEDLLRGHMPASGEDDDFQWFHRDDPDECRVVLGKLLDAADKGSLFRVVFGMLVVLDPRNELLDPDADTIEKHPKIKQNAERWRETLQHVGARYTGEGNRQFTLRYLKPVEGADILRGSVAEHFTQAIDESLRADKEPS